jgi:hypothetical protein
VPRAGRRLQGGEDAADYGRILEATEDQQPVVAVGLDVCAVLGVPHIVMFPAMFAVMLLRREEYPTL